MKKIIFYGVSLLIGIALFIGVIWRVGADKIWQAIIDFSFGKWLIVVALYILTMIITVYRWKLILKSQGYNLRMSQLFPAKIVGFTADYLTPSPNVGGEAIRAYVIKKDAGVSFSDGLASVIIDKIMDFSYALPFVIFGIYYIIIHFNLSLKVFAALLLVSAAFIFLLGFFYYRTFRQKAFFGSIIRFFQLHRLAFMAKVMDKIAKFEQAIIDFFRHDRKTFWYGLWLSVIGGAITIFTFWLIMVFLGLHVSLLEVILIATMIVVTFLLPIPGSFGTTETGEAVIFNQLGYPAETGVVFTLIFRSVDLVKVAIGLFFLSHFGLKLGQTILGKTALPAEGNGKEIQRK